MVPALVRIEDIAIIIVADNPLHPGDALDVAGADKVARSMQLSNALSKRLLEDQVRNGVAMSIAATLEIDAVIDPAEFRGWC